MKISKKKLVDAAISLSEYEFTVNEIQFKIIDVGGDKDERRRWIDFLQVLYFY
jgi:hypothetical protein